MQIGQYVLADGFAEVGLGLVAQVHVAQRVVRGQRLPPLRGMGKVNAVARPPAQLLRTT